MEEVRPAAGVYPPKLHDAVVSRYQFVSRPTDYVEAAKTGAKFQMGSIKIKKQEMAVGKLEIYNDGIIVVTTDTRYSDIVMEDFIEWVTKSFDLKPRQTLVPRQHASSIVVEFERAFDKLLRHSFSSEFSSTLKEHHGFAQPVNLSKLAFSIDPMLLPPSRNGQLIIERRAGVTYSKNRFFCSAPLPTDVLIHLMEKFEQIIPK
jgi:hypothetical protein